MSASLVIASEEGLTLELRLGSQPITVGRAKDNILRSDDRRLSRHHVVFRRLEDSSFEVEDVGSSYGTLLNGRPIKQEPLKPQDQVRCGGLQIQIVERRDEGPQAEPSLMTSTVDALRQSREQITKLISEQALLRREVGIAQEAEDRAKRLRDEAHDEVERLHDTIAELTCAKEALTVRVEELGRELRDRLSSKIDPRTEELTRQLGEAQKLVEKQKTRIAELEEKDATRVSTEGPLRKEVERLTELLKRRDQRELELQAAVKPAILRIAELTRELEATRLELAHAQADLDDLKRGVRR
jgi:pSer/pThr/pTyr-binding forkhead associated (FHA) protein